MKKLIFLLFVALFVSLSQATIVKFEAEDPSLYYISGNWQDGESANASGGIYITAIVNGTTEQQANRRYYKLDIPAGTYNLYVRLSMETAGGRFVNDSFYTSDSSFSLDAGMRTQNNTAATGLDGVSGDEPSFAWYSIDDNFVSDGGDSYFMLSTREDGCHVDAIAFADETVSDAILNAAAITTGNKQPHDPLVTPEWEGIGTVGSLQANNTDVEVTFAYKASADPNEDYPMNPEVIGHYLFLTVDGSDVDPNMTQIAYIPHGDMNDPNVVYGPYQYLEQDMKYKWQAEDAKDSGGGTPYPSGDPNNIPGAVWSFTTIAAKPVITVDPENVLTDLSGNAQMSITAGPAPIITGYQWYKVGDPDVALSNAGIYSGTDTDTLTITGAGASDDGQFYCIAYNGAIASDPSASAWLWYPRLVSQYPFETIDVVDGNNVTSDTISGFDAIMVSYDIGVDVPVLEPNAVANLGSTNSLKLDNPAGSDPNAADAQAAQIPATSVGSYQDITISGWVYWNGGGIWQRIVDFGNDTNNYIFMSPQGNTGGLRMAVKVGGTEQSVVGSSGPGTIPIGEWTYVTGTLSGDTGRVYVDGELVGTNTGMTLDPVDYGPTSNNYIGKSQWPDPYFDGMIDELKIYNYARTTVEIAQDYLDVEGDWVCNQELNDLGYDYDGNCELGLGDLAIIVDEWATTYRIYPE